MSLDRDLRWRCSACSRSWEPAEVKYTCLRCGSLLDGGLKDYSAAAAAAPPPDVNGAGLDEVRLADAIRRLR